MGGRWIRSSYVYIQNNNHDNGIEWELVNETNVVGEEV